MRPAWLLLPAVLAAAAAKPPADPVLWDAPATIATGGGERGPWRQNDSRYDHVDDATVAIDANGELVAAWVDQARKDVFLQRFGPDARPARLPAPVNVSRSPDTFSWLPRLRVDPREPRRVYLLWQEIIFSGGAHGGDILFARSTDGGRSFEPPLNLSRSVGGDGKGRVDRDRWHNGSQDFALAADGTIHAVWTEYDGMLWHATSRDAGASFGSPRHRFGTRERPARAPAVAIDARGGVLLAWTVGEDPAADIHVARAADGDAFGPPIVVERTPGYSDAPKLAIGRDGVVHLVFGEHPGGPLAQGTLRYTRSRDGGVSFEAPREVAGDASFPSLALGSAGELLVLGEVGLAAERRSQGLGLAVSHDGGDRFTPFTPVPGSRDPRGANGSFQGLLMEKLAAGGGRVVVANSTLVPGRGSRAWLVSGGMRKFER